MRAIPQCSLPVEIVSAGGPPGTRKAQPASLSIPVPAERLLWDKCLFSISRTTSLTTGESFFATAIHLRNLAARPALEMMEVPPTQTVVGSEDTPTLRSR